MKLKLIQARAEANAFDKSSPEYKGAATFKKWLDHYLKNQFPSGSQEIISTKLTPAVDTYDTTYHSPGVEVYAHTPRRDQRLAYFIFTDDKAVWYTDATDEENKWSYRLFFRDQSNGTPSIGVTADLRSTIMDWVQD